MSHSRISAAASRVQAMPPMRRALLAREALIYAAGGEMAFGPAEARLRQILAKSGLGGMVAISLALLIRRIWAGRGVKGKSESSPDILFIGIDALREQSLRAEITAKTGHSPVFVDQRAPAGFATLPSPRTVQVFKNWCKAIRLAWSILSVPDPDFTRGDMLSSLTIRCHELAYLVSVFEKIHSDRPDTRIICSTSDIASHASSLAGFAPEFHQHGLLAEALVFPSFSEMIALTKYEGRHVSDRVPGIVIQTNEATPPSATPARVLALVGDYLAIDPVPVTSLVELSLSQGIEVVVRPHPKGHDVLWSDIRDKKGVVFESEGSFDDFLSRWRPAFLASWYSTTLVDGLISGALPITFSAGKSPLLLPLSKISLAFPQERGRVLECFIDPTKRSQIHNVLLKVLQ